jgi:BTB/POZ domain
LLRSLAVLELLGHRLFVRRIFKRKLSDVQFAASTLINLDKKRRDSLFSLLDNHEFSDIVFDVHGEILHYHRCILAARSPYFRLQFAGKWRDRKIIYNHHPLVSSP